MLIFEKKMDISILIRATWPYFRFSSFQLYQNEKKKKQAQKILNNFHSLILTTLLAQ